MVGRSLAEQSPVYVCEDLTSFWGEREIMAPELVRVFRSWIPILKGGILLESRLNSIEGKNSVSSFIESPVKKSIDKIAWGKSDQVDAGDSIE